MPPRPHVRSTVHDFEFMTGRCMRCGVTRSEAGDSKCTGRYKLVDAEVDGSIQRRMREIARGEGREVAEPGAGDASGLMPLPYKGPSTEMIRLQKIIALARGAGLFRRKEQTQWLT